MEVLNANRQVPELKLEINAQRNFVKFINKLGEKPKTTVRCFDHTDYYTVHGADDCDLIGKIVYKSNVYTRQMLEGEAAAVPYVTLSKSNFELAVRELLLIRKYRVEVYVRRTGDNAWHVEYRGSPGNLLQFEDILFANKEVLVGNVILSVQMRQEGAAQRKLGVAAVEQNDCQFQLLEFIDDDFFTELEATIVLLGPKECLLPALDGEYEPIKTLLERNGVMVTIVKKAKSDNKDEFIQDMNRLLRFEKGQQEDASALQVMQLTVATAALRGAVKYLDLTSDEANFGHYEIQQINLKRFVHLDAAAVSALNLLPTPGATHTIHSARWHSILGVLDHCRTPQGHRLMAQWIKQPLRSRDILTDRHNIVQCLLEAPTALNTLHEELLKRIPDVLMLTKKLMRKKASLQDLFRIYQMLLRTPEIINLLLDLDNVTVTSVLVDAFKSHLEDLSGLKQMVEQTLDFDAIDTREFLVNASFDKELAATKKRMTDLMGKMQRLQEQADEDLDLDSKSVRLENVTHIGYHFRSTIKDDSILRKKKNYTIIDVVKGGVRFTTVKLKEYSEKFSTLRAEYEEQQQSIVLEVIKVATGYAAPLTALNNEIAQLDCLVSFAIAAQTAPTPYVRPTMLEEGSGILTLKGIRHPCLELQEHVTFIANDLEFHKDTCNMMIITGPNMGGKSTYIRSVGTAVLMAHIGAFVPCSEATISMVDAILGRVGASDNIIKGLSTFMVEMIETSGIVRTATDKSLVIIDELGRGTSTYEGCGIAWSIAEYLAKEIKCFSLFATHFHEITKLTETVQTVKNYHMAAAVDAENFTLLYQVRPGVTEKSFGIQVARIAEFPEEVVAYAERVYNQFEDQHAAKQTAADKALIARVDTAIEQLARTGNDVDIDEANLTRLVEEFRREIEQLDSEYFKTLQATVADSNE